MTAVALAASAWPEERVGLRRWSVAALVVLLAHVAIGVWLIHRRLIIEPQQGSPAAVLIDLPPLAVTPAAPSSMPPAPEAKPPEPAPPPPAEPAPTPPPAPTLVAPPVEPLPAEPAPPPPAPAVVTPPPIEAPPVPAPNPAVVMPPPAPPAPTAEDRERERQKAIQAERRAAAAREKRRQEAEREQRRQEAERERRREQDAMRRTAAAARARAAAAASRDAAASRAARAGAPTISSSAWQAEVMAKLHRSQHYPEAARSRGEQGTASVSFSVASSGAVVGARLARSSGSTALDAESLATIRRASPLPRPPAALGGRVNLTVPVRFSLR